MKRLIAACLLVFCATSPVRAEDIAVAAASDLNFAIKELIGAFEKRTGHHVKLSLGSSGNFLPNSSRAPPSTCIFQRTSAIPGSWRKRG